MNSKIIIRDTKYMVYIKEAEKISDFLKVINAYQAVLYYENIRIYKEQKNNTNRLNNCEQANIDKIIETCNNQIKDIFSINENKHKTQIRLIDGSNWKTYYTTSQIQDILRNQYNKKHKL
jgi:DNA-binding protein WhiA